MRYVCVSCDRPYDQPMSACPVDGAPVVQRDDQTQLLPGTRLDGRFQVESRLGQGGMGTVYRGTQVSVGRPVAIKILRQDRVQSDDLVRRFYREARVISRLNHPNIVSLIDFGATSDGLLYLVMEFVRGSTLLDELRHGPVQPTRAVRIAMQVCDALAEAHAQGVIHRDLKPENIVLTGHATRRDFVKVLDFGIATAVDVDAHGRAIPAADAAGVDSRVQAITAAGAVIGTPAYMSPEQVAGEANLSPASDLYALTLILFEMLTGRRAFVGDAAAAVLMQQLLQSPPRLRDVASDRNFPPQLEAFVRRGLAKCKEDRIQEARAYGAELTEVAQGRDYVPGSDGASDAYAPVTLLGPFAGLAAGDALAHVNTEDDPNAGAARRVAAPDKKWATMGTAANAVLAPDWLSRAGLQARDAPAKRDSNPLAVPLREPAASEAAPAPSQPWLAGSWPAALAAAGVAAVAALAWLVLLPTPRPATAPAVGPAAGPPGSVLSSLAGPAPMASPAAPAPTSAPKSTAVAVPTPTAMPTPPTPTAVPSPPSPAGQHEAGPARDLPASGRAPRPVRRNRYGLQ